MGVVTGVLRAEWAIWLRTKARNSRRETVPPPSRSIRWISSSAVHGALPEPGRSLSISLADSSASRSSSMQIVPSELRGADEHLIACGVEAQAWQPAGRLAWLRPTAHERGRVLEPMRRVLRLEAVDGAEEVHARVGKPGLHECLGWGGRCRWVGGRLGRLQPADELLLGPDARREHVVEPCAITEHAVHARRAVRQQLHLGHGGATVVLSLHVRVGRVSHHDLEHWLRQVGPTSLDDGRAVAVRGVPHEEPRNATRVELTHERLGGRQRHAAWCEVPRQHHSRLVRRHHIVDERMASARRLVHCAVVVRPARLGDPLGDLFTIPHVERVHPLADILDELVAPRHMAQRTQRAPICDVRVVEPPVHKQIGTDDDRELAKQQQLAHEAALGN
eukprot:scaffold172613_cov23-Tisochrysis_lutea.AAC.3